MDESPKELDKLLQADVTLDGYAAAIVSMEAYDETYGIADYSYDDPSKPLALIAMHPKEDFTTGGPMERTIKDYRVHKVHKHYAMSLLEFLELPRHVARFILDDCMEQEKAEGKKAEEIMRTINGGVG